MPEVSVAEARAMLSSLAADLHMIVQHDQEQEVLGIARAPVEAALEAAKQHVPLDHPVVSQIREAWSVAVIQEPDMRAVDLLVVVDLLLDALGPPPPPPVRRHSPFD